MLGAMKRTIVGILAVLLVAATGVLPSLAATRTVKIKDDFFSPNRLTIGKGTTVKWKWVGNDPHNVTLIKSPRGVKHTHSTTKTSGTYSKTLRKAGTYTFKCTIHDFTMKVVVR
jgi:plastocyanin